MLKPSLHYSFSDILEYRFRNSAKMCLTIIKTHAVKPDEVNSERKMNAAIEVSHVDRQTEKEIEMILNSLPFTPESFIGKIADISDGKFAFILNKEDFLKYREKDGFKIIDKAWRDAALAAKDRKPE